MKYLLLSCLLSLNIIGNAQCMDLGELDFGACDMAMGIAYVDGGCIALSGCGWEVDGVDYSPYSFESFGQCESACGDSLCIDPSIIDPYVICPAVIDPVCGCDSVTYNNSCEAYNWYGVQEWTEGPCGETSEDCIDPNLIDPDVLCADFFEPVCGCDSMLYQNDCIATFHNGVTIISSGPCQETNVCVDQDQINLATPIPLIWDPVCGCDSITYSNSSEAFFHGGIQSWTPGECDTPNVIWQVEERSLNVSPNPFIDQFTLSLGKRTEGILTVVDLAGRELVKMSVYPGRNVVNLDATPSGLYMVYLMHENGFVLTSKVIKQ